MKIKYFLFHDSLFLKIYFERNYLADMNPVESIEFMKDRLQKTKDNTEFLISMNG